MYSWKSLKSELWQEGGFAATVLGLMSSNKLQFRTEVPEQLVVLDPNMASVDENYVRILQRYKELLKNAGSMDESDIEMMRSPSKQVSVLRSLSVLSVL